MSTTPPPPSGPSGGPSFTDENANRVASESLTNYDAAADIYHCSYGPPIPAATVHDQERDILVRIDPETRQVVGFSIPNFRDWYASNSDPDGSFEVDLPEVWPTDDNDEAP
jgi:uncharacterized protein YuzE